MKSLNIAASVAVALTLMSGSVMAKGLPKFHLSTITKTVYMFDGQGMSDFNMSVWNVNGIEYTNGPEVYTKQYVAWFNKHEVKIFSNKPAMFVSMKALEGAFGKQFHPIYDGPNLAPPLPKGTTMAQWKAAVVQAKEAASAYRTVSFAQTNEPWQYSPLATKTQWFNDPSDPFYNKSFPVKDLKDGFVLNRKPLVIVQRTKGHAGIFVTQYVGGGTNGTYWEGEMLNAKGQVVQIATGLGASPNDEASYLHPYTNLGEKINTSSAPPSVIWGAGAGTDVVPLPKWNPLWVLSLQNA